MDLVAGPQGSGKSTFFPVASRGRDSFNIDDHRRVLNGGTSQGFSPEIQTRAKTDYEAFIASHIETGTGFSIEVTLAKDVTFEQAKRARAAGFAVNLTYVATDVDECVARVANRVEAGGHGTKVEVLKETHAASMRNIARAIKEFDVVQIHDNSMQAHSEDSASECQPRRVLESQRGAVIFRDSKPPRWLKEALKGTGYL